MKFSLLDIFKVDDHWWVSFIYFEVNDSQFAGLHIEYDQGMWKWDFLGLYGLVHWLRERREERKWKPDKIIVDESEYLKGEKK